MGRWLTILLLALVTHACDSTKATSISGSIDGNWEGQLSDTSYLLIIRLSPTGAASGQGAEFRPGALGSSFGITGTYGHPGFVLHFDGPTYPVQFIGTLRTDDTMAGEFHVDTPTGQRTRAGVIFSRQQRP